MVQYVEVALPIPLRKNFTYAVPEAMAGSAERGHRVAVPFGRRKLAGIVVAHLGEVPAQILKIKPIAGLVESETLFGDELLAFLERAASYYMHALGDVLATAAPSLPSDALRRLRKEGFLQTGEKIRGSRVSTRP